MGRKHRKQQDDDEYFSALTSSSTELAPQAGGGETEANVLQEDEKSDEGNRARQAEVAAAAQEQVRLAEEAANRERAKKAAMAKAMMSKRSKKSGAEEAAEPLQEARNATQEQPQDVLSALGHILLFLRSHALKSGVFAVVARIALAVLSSFATIATLRTVDKSLASTSPQQSADEERMRRDCLYCPETGVYFERRPVPKLPTLRRADDGSYQRLQRNFKTKSSQETWLRVKDGDGWVTLHKRHMCLALFENHLFECTEWLAAHLLDVKDAPDDLVDTAKPIFTVSRDAEGHQIATLARKIQEDLRRQQQESAGISAHGGVPSKSKVKLSKAEKKAKKLSYGR